MSQPIIGFRIWYDTGQVVVGRTLDDWRAAPDTGVVVVATYHNGRRAVHTSHDWYIFDGERIEKQGYGWHDPGFPPPQDGKKGVWVQDSVMESMRRQAVYGTI